MIRTNAYLIILSSSLTLISSAHAMNQPKDKPQENSGVIHYVAKMLFPRSYVCDPENNQRYLVYKAKIQSTPIEQLKEDEEFGEEFKRCSERLEKLQCAIEVAIKNKDLDTLTLLYTYNNELPDPLDLVRKALTEGHIKISNALKKDAATKKDAPQNK